MLRNRFIVPSNTINSEVGTITTIIIKVIAEITAENIFRIKLCCKNLNNLIREYFFISLSLQP
jgi:hypothetical protein